MLSFAESATKLLIKGDSKELYRLSNRLRFRPSGYHFAPQYQLYELTDGKQGWNGFIHLLRIDEDEDSAGRCLRGHKDDILRECRKMGISTNTEKTLKSPFRGILSDDLPDDLIQSKFQLDQWQREGIAYWLSYGIGVNKIAVNGGKTLMFSAAASMILRRYQDDGIIYITQSERLCTQTYNEVKKFLPDWKVTRYGAGQKDPSGSIVICTVAMLWRNRLELKSKQFFNRFIGVFYDECFVAGTLIDGKPIENIRVGEQVKSVNERAWCIEYRPVLRVFKSRPASLIKITFSDDKSLICTPFHPFRTLTGWQPAIELTKTSMVISEWHADDSLQKLPDSLPSDTAAIPGETSLLRRNLQARVLAQTQFRNHDANEFEICLGAHAIEQSDAQTFYAPKGVHNFAANKTSTASTRRQRKTVARSAKAPGSSLGLAHRSFRKNRLLEGSTRVPDSLFFGHRETGLKNLRRSRWIFAPSTGDQKTRHETNHIFRVKRVDRVEILQPTSDGTFGGMCPDGHVYNLEVEGNHNYFARNCLVHNCHHAHSTTSEKILLNIPAFFRFGASDSVHESDEAKATKVRGLLGPLRIKVEIGEYIAIGRTAKPHLYLVDVPSWRNKFDDMPFRAVPGTNAWALIGNDWKKGVYAGPVYERDDAGEIVTRKKRVLVGVNVDEFINPDTQQIEESKSGDWEERELPVTVDNCHHLIIDGEDFSVDSRYCLLDRVTDKAIVTFKERNNLIVEWVKFWTQEHNYQTLVVCTRTLHVMILESLVKDAVGKNVEILFSDHGRSDRDKVFHWFKNTPGSVLISPLVKEGVSINEIRAGVVADSVADHEVMRQIIGRMVRKKNIDNHAHITLFMDGQHSVLRRGSNRWYRRLKDVRGFTFYYPVTTPSSISSAVKYESLAD